MFKDYDFTKLALHLDGTNGKLSDIDLYDGVRYSLKKDGLTSKFQQRPYFSQNPILKFISEFFLNKEGKTIRSTYLDVLSQLA